MPALGDYWYIAMLGKNRLIAAELPIANLEIFNFLASHKFKIAQATWQYQPTPPFSKNPFLSLESPSIAIAASQTPSNQLLLDPTNNPIKIFGQSQTPPQAKGYIFFIVTRDYQFLKIGYSQNPHSRYKEIQASRPDQLIYLGSRSSESSQFEYICTKFADQHIRNGWYHLDAELQNTMENYLS